MMVKKKVLFVLMVALIGQFIGYAQDHTEKTVKELLISKEWIQEDNSYVVVRFEEGLFYYRILPHPYLTDMPQKYYLSDVFLKEFDENSVGKTGGSKYLYLRSFKRESSFCVFEIRDLTEDKLVMREIYNSDDPDGTAVVIGRKILERTYIPYKE